MRSVQQKPVEPLHGKVYVTLGVHGADHPRPEQPHAADAELGPQSCDRHRQS